MDPELEQSSQAERHYTYNALPTRTSHIRLIRLLPHVDRHAPLRDHLIEYELQRSGDVQTHLYEALSYVWGDPKERVLIIVDGLPLFITTNLHAALVQLRNHTFERALWVDAICIDQDNLNERADQVQLMAHIYASASTILVWLGEERDESGRIMRFIASLADPTKGQNGWECPSCGGLKKLYEKCSHCGFPGLKEIHVVQGFVQLFERAWFYRVWVLQEVAAAKHVLIMCGQHRVDGYALSAGYERLAQQGSEMTTNPRTGQLLPVLGLIRGATYRQLRLKSKPAEKRLEIGNLAALVNMFRPSEASYPRDKIFALLNMQTDGPDYADLTPDYTIDWDLLFERLTRAFLGLENTSKLG